MLGLFLVRLRRWIAPICFTVQQCLVITTFVIRLACGTISSPPGTDLIHCSILLSMQTT